VALALDKAEKDKVAAEVKADGSQKHTCAPIAHSVRPVHRPLPVGVQFSLDCAAPGG